MICIVSAINMIYAASDINMIYIAIGMMYNLYCQWLDV